MPAMLITFLLLSLQVFANSDFCRPLNIGESFTVNLSDMKSASNVEQKYTLKRSEANVYEAYINMNFKYKGHLKSDSIVKDSFEAKVDRCLTEFDNTLTDELGRTLRIVRYRPELHSDIKPPQAVSIDVQNINSRSHSRSYHYEARCTTILHEALHLMGLADEYEESWTSVNPNPISRIFKPITSLNENGPAFDCRAIGPTYSVMRSSYLVGTLKREQVFFSGQLNVILHPNCQQQNDDYYACSNLAYRTSKQNGSAKGCGEVRDICKTSQWIYAKESPEREPLELYSHHNDGDRNFDSAKDTAYSAKLSKSKSNKQ